MFYYTTFSGKSQYADITKLKKTSPKKYTLLTKRGEQPVKKVFSGISLSLIASSPQAVVCKSQNLMVLFHLNRNQELPPPPRESSARIPSPLHKEPLL